MIAIDYIGDTKIPKSHIKTHQRLLSDGLEINDLLQLMFPVTLNRNMIKNILHEAYRLGIEIDNLQLYSYVHNLETTIIAIDENNCNTIAAFTSFTNRPDVRESLWQVKNAKIYASYVNKEIIGKIFKFLKEDLEFSIQSDFKQTRSTNKLWTETLPSVGLYPKIIDLETSNVYNNDGKIVVYGNKRYCWILESGDYYRNLVIKNQKNLIQPFTNYYITKKNYKKCNTQAWYESQGKN